MRPPRMLFVAFLILVASREAAVSRDDPPELVAPTGPRMPAEERAGFHLPPGFEIQLVASDPDIHKPMNIAFDDRGRLWVTETVEYPFPAEKGKTPRDAVKILEDFGPDGRARKITTFADGLNIPIGLLPMPGGNEALVHSIPTIDRFTDTDGDGKADKREVAYKTFGARDTHGMTNAFTWGFDGWIYACHGFSNASEIAGNDGKGMKLVSGNSYRMKADGSHAEQFSHGQVNPFGLCFNARGELFSADCHSKPVYNLLRNGWYPSFGVPDDGLGFAPEMVSHDHGSTAISGVVFYLGDMFPREYQHSVFIGNVVTNRINRDDVGYVGSTPKGKIQPDFLTSDDRWFRPVDLKLGPDGALYVADFYNKIIGHYEVPLTHPGRDRERGRIWRIVYRGTDGKAVIPKLPDFTKMTTTELIAELNNPNLARRILATNRLVANKSREVIDAAKDALKESPYPTSRIHAMWALERLKELDQASLLMLMTDSATFIRNHALRVAAERVDLDDTLLFTLRHNLESADAVTGSKIADPTVVRTAADALGRHPHPGNLRSLLDARHRANPNDLALTYVLRQALRDQFLSVVPWPKLDDAAYSEADFRTLADVALGAPTKDSAKFVAAFLAKYSEDRGATITHVHHVARHGDAETDGMLLAFATKPGPDDFGLQAEMVKAVFRGLQERGAPFAGATRDWATETTTKLLNSKDNALVLAGIELAGQIKLTDAHAPILALLTSPSRSEAIRMAAASTLATIEPAKSAEPLGKVVLDEKAPYPVREAAATALAKSNSDETRRKLVELLPLAPERLQVTIAAALSTNRPGAEALIDAVTRGKASARLLQERAVRVFLDGSGIPDLQAKIVWLTAGITPLDARVAELLARRRLGLASARPDLKRGAELFTKNCATCHQVAGQGARIGPQLDGIGVRGGDRLIEDVLDPNRNIDQAFRLTTLALKDGRVASGLVLREEGDVLVMADAQGKEQRFPKGEIEDRKVSPVSPMPADFAEKMPDAEFYDLIAYLLSRKSP